jgi:hypothetical protein
MNDKSETQINPFSSSSLYVTGDETSPTDNEQN